MHMHKSRVNAMYSVGLECLFDENYFFDPSDPIVTPDPNHLLCVSSG